MKYHSYSVEYKGSVYDYNRDIAQKFVVILGGEDKVSIENQLLEILDENLS